ncbi:hypothetical protein KY321_01365 [Candidatus Woesearchaeota archaeon]|nr:hypothetical protein [Candidatus Woesearchaeota archaeon]
MSTTASKIFENSKYRHIMFTEINSNSSYKVETIDDRINREALILRMHIGFHDIGIKANEGREYAQRLIDVFENYDDLIDVKTTYNYSNRSVDDILDEVAFNNISEFVPISFNQFIDLKSIYIKTKKDQKEGRDRFF